MNEWVSNIVEQVRALPPQRQLVLLATAVGSLAFLWWVAAGVGAQDFKQLYRGLDPEEAANVTEALQGLKIPYRLEAGGTTVAVPAEQLHEARIRIAGKGLPGSVTTGFELFDRPAFGVTDFVHEVNYTRAIQGELARSIEQLEPVERARVQVVSPKGRGVLEATRRKASASVLVALAPNRELAADQVQAIVHLVASSIESLEPGAVTVVDDAGRLLAPNGEQTPGSRAPGGALSHQSRVETSLARRIETILEPVVGMGRVVARVSAEMDWTESEITEERFDPDSQIARSESRTEEQEGSGGLEGGAPGVVSNVAGEGVGDASSTSSTRSTETYNYELSKTVSHRVTAMGTIQRLSIAVLVDEDPGGTGGAAEGDATAGEEPPRWSSEQLERFEQLAMQAVGFSGERGDQIVVSSAPFRGPEIVLEEGGFNVDPRILTYGSQALRIVAQLLALILFGQFIVKPLLGSVSKTAVEAGAAAALPASVASLEAALEGGAAAPELAIPAAPLTLAEQVSVEAGARSEDSMTTIRNWLNQE